MLAALSPSMGEGLMDFGGWVASSLGEGRVAIAERASGMPHLASSVSGRIIEGSSEAVRRGFKRALRSPERQVEEEDIEGGQAPRGEEDLTGDVKRESTEAFIT